MATLQNQLADIVGERYVSAEDFAVYAVYADAGFEKGGLAGMIVRPQTTEQVSEIMKLASRTKTPVTLRGGASSGLRVVPRRPLPVAS